MASLQFWEDPWKLDVAVCPCDVHFTGWLDQNGLKGQRIFHFGTGDHHLVGLHAPANGNAVMGITATEPEYETYMRLVVENPDLGKFYKVIFSDIYQLNGALLPAAFDVVTLFHLCEFWNDNNAPFASVNDRGVLDLLSARVVPGGHLLFYKGSFAYEKAAQHIAEWAPGSGFEELPGHETLRIFRRKA